MDQRSPDPSNPSPSPPAPAPPPDPASSSEPFRPRLSRRRKVAFSLTLLLLVFGTMETIHRFRESGLQEHQSELKRFDPYTGFVYEPGASVTVGASRGGQTVAFTLNALGHRGEDLAAEKPPGALRVVCLGGSTTFGTGATCNEAAYPRQLQDLLRAQMSERPVEVLNAGIAGWNLRNSLTNYQLRLASLDFDIAVVMHANNDLFENARSGYHADSHAKGPEDVYRPKSLFARALESSAFVRFLQDRARGHIRRHYKSETLDEEGIAAYGRNLDATVRALRADGVAPVLCTMPNLYPPTYEEATRVFPNGKGIIDFSLRRAPVTYPVLASGFARYNEVCRQKAREHGVPLVDLERTFPRETALYIDFIHHNDAGSALKARLVHQALVDSGLLMEKR